MTSVNEQLGRSARISFPEDMQIPRETNSCNSSPYKEAVQLSKGDLQEIICHGVIDAISKLGMLEHHNEVLRVIAPIENRILTGMRQLNFHWDVESHNQMLEAFAKIKVDVDPPDLSGIEQIIMRDHEKVMLLLQEEIRQTRKDIFNMQDDLKSKIKELLKEEFRASSQSLRDDLKKLVHEDLKIIVEPPDLGSIEQMLLKLTNQEEKARCNMQEDMKSSHRAFKEDIRRMVNEDLNVVVEPPNLTRIQQTISQLSSNEEQARYQLKEDIKQFHQLLREDISKLITECTKHSHKQLRDDTRKFFKEDLNVVLEPPDLSEIQLLISQQDEKTKNHVMDGIRDMHKSMIEDVREASKISEQSNKEFKEDIKGWVFEGLNVIVEPPDLSETENMISNLRDHINHAHDELRSSMSKMVNEEMVHGIKQILNEGLCVARELPERTMNEQIVSELRHQEGSLEQCIRDDINNNFEELRDDIKNIVNENIKMAVESPCSLDVKQLMTDQDERTRCFFIQELNQVFKEFREAELSTASSNLMRFEEMVSKLFQQEKSLNEEIKEDLQSVQADLNLMRNHLSEIFVNDESNANVAPPGMLIEKMISELGSISKEANLHLKEDINLIHEELHVMLCSHLELQAEKICHQVQMGRTHIHSDLGDMLKEIVDEAIQHSNRDVKNQIKHLLDDFHVFLFF